jgi:hypothetical protein
MKKILLTRALAAKKKIFVMAFLAVFSSFYTMVWGDKYNYKSGIASCSVNSESLVDGNTIFRLGIGVRGLNGSTYASTLTLVLSSSDHTLEGTYSTADENNKITDDTYIKYSTQKNRTPNSDSLSIITIEKIGAPDYCYRISGGKLLLKNTDDNLYNYYFCYALDADKNVIENTLSHYDFGYIKYAVTGTSPNQTLTISGYGAMNNYSTTINAPWYSFRAGIKNVIIEDGVISVGEYAFYNCTTLVSITVPVSVTSFGSNAFHSCKKTQNIYYAGSTNQWAGITFGNQTAHPYGTTSSLPSGVAEARSYYFNGSNTATTDLVFAYGLTNIKAYTFCNAGTLTSVSIPGSVTDIGTYALYSKFAEVYVNKATAPTLSTTNPISFIEDGVLYIPKDASNYDESHYWKKYDYRNTYGAKTVIQKPVSGSVDGQSWSLNENGVLTIDGSGAISTTFTDESGASQYPYYYFRYLVDKVVVKGGITGLSNILQRAQAMRTLEFQQDNISSATTVTPTSYIYDSPITMLFPYTAVENVNLSTWSSYKRQLSNAANIDQSEDNVSLLAALHNNLTEPFNINLTRTLSNTMYNTYCSPIDMSAEEVTALFGEDTHLVELDAENTGMNEDDKLVIAFKDATEITAGTPYLIQPANNVVNPSFTNVDPSKVAAEEGVVETEHVDFHGTLNKRTISETEIKNQSVIFLTGTIVDGKQQLTWANGGTLNGMRAYWKVKEGTPASVMAKRPVLQIGNGENTTTDLGQVPSDKIQCTKVLRDGQIYILRGEKAYNLQGIEIETTRY